MRKIIAIKEDDVARRFESPDGMVVLVGKSAADNDTLTFKVAAQTDFWMHVAGESGSHVVVRNPDNLESLPRETLRFAASLAAGPAGAADEGQRLWKQVEALAGDAANEHVLIENLAYHSFDGTTLRLSIRTADEGLARWLTGQAQPLADLVKRATARRVDVVVEESSVEDDRALLQQRKDEARDLPMVRTAIEIFDAEVIDVKETPDDAG